MRKFFLFFGVTCFFSSMSLGAFPTILLNSTTGSDTAASGAGPATAITGSTMSTSATGLVVTLSGSPDLTDVAVDGSHVIYIPVTETGARNFSKITAKDGSLTSTASVTVSDAFRVNLSSSLAWAIGGKRLRIGSSTSNRLINNNSASGDAMPGWTIEMEPGYTENYTTTLNFYRAGDTTSGPITFQGSTNAVLGATLTYQNTSSGLIPRASYWIFKNFVLLASSVATTAVDASAGAITFDSLKIGKSGSGSFTSFENGSGFSGNILNCDIGNMTSHGLNLDATLSHIIKGNWIHDNGGSGINFNSSEMLGIVVTGNLIESNTGDGITFPGTTNTALSRSAVFSNNTFYANGADGIEITNPPIVSWKGIQLYNNIFSNNTGYGINFSNGSSTLIALQAVQMQIRNNNTFSNSSGPYNPSGLGVNDPGLDPQFTDAANSNFTIGTNLKAQGFIEGSIGFSPTNNYLDIGAAQRQESSSTSGGSFTFVQ